MDKTPVEMVRDLVSQSTYVSLCTVMSPAIEDDMAEAGVHLAGNLVMENIVQAERDEIGTVFRQEWQNNGWPYASVAAVFVVDYVPYMLVSELSEHTKNILVNSRVSLLVNDESFKDGNKAIMARVSLMGEAVIADKDKLRDAYLAAKPKAKAFYDFGDMHLYRVDVQCARLVAGFGKAWWISGAEIRGESDGKG